MRTVASSHNHRSGGFEPKGFGGGLSYRGEMNLKVTMGASIHLVMLGITDRVTVPNRIIQTTSSLCKA